MPETLLTETEIRMPGGHLTITQLIALLNTIPMEITFVDVDNINRFFNEGPKDFKRPWMDKNGKCMLVRYMAVRDKEGKYLGTLELVQDMGFAKEHFQPEKRQEEIW